jgi:hypothetical protein
MHHEDVGHISVLILFSLFLLVLFYILQEGACFLFDCGRPDDFKCQFDPNESYITGALEIDRHLFEVDI